MKKISVWKVVLLSLVTFGIYSVVWLARRRNEIVKKYKLYVPHWLWLVAPCIIWALLLAPLAFIAYGTGNSFEGSALTFMGLILIGVLITCGISLWWIWHFGKAVERITQGRITLAWVFVYWLLLGFVLVPMVQFYANRVSGTAKLSSKNKYKPSQKFVSLSILLILLSIAAGVVYSMASVKDWSDFTEQNKAVDEKFTEVDRLTKAYEVCIDELNAAYPEDELSDEEYAAYEKADAHCEELRIKQNAAVDAYDAAVEQY